MFLVLLFFFVGMTVFEFKTIAFVYGYLAASFGGFAAVAAIILSFMLSMSLGIRLIHNRCSLLLQKVQMGQVLKDESGQTLLFFLAGLLLIIPGYLSDVFAVLCLFPPTGWLVRKIFQKLIGKMAIKSSMAFEGMAGRRTRYWYSQMPEDPDKGSSDPTIIDVEVTDTPKRLN